VFIRHEMIEEDGLPARDILAGGLGFDQQEVPIVFHDPIDIGDTDA
jgi:hypothetical protein